MFPLSFQTSSDATSLKFFLIPNYNNMPIICTFRELVFKPFHLMLCNEMQSGRGEDLSIGAVQECVWTGIHELNDLDISIFHFPLNDKIHSNNDVKNTCHNWLLGEISEVTHILNLVYRRESNNYDFRVLWLYLHHH